MSSSAGLLGAMPNNSYHDHSSLDASGFYSKPTSQTHDNHSVMYSKASSQKYKENNHLYCDVCKLRGHTKEVCYKVVGYLPGFKSKRKEHIAYNVHTV